MLLNFILLVIIIIGIYFLFRQIKRDKNNNNVLPECKFIITKPEYHLDNDVRIAKYSVISKTSANRYFRDFPLAFKFYSNHKFRSKIRITYNVSGDEEVEVIYDRVVVFEDNAKEHIYYVNDVIVGSIDIEIYTHSDYGKPTVGFEILQSDICHMSKEHKIEINFPH